MRPIVSNVEEHNLTSALTSRQGSDPTTDDIRLLVDSVRDYAIFLLDPNGNILTWNRGAERIKGYSPDEIIGRHFSTFYPSEDVAAGKPEEELRVAVRDARVEVEQAERETNLERAAELKFGRIPELEEQVAAADVVLDCSDNFATRHAINRACVRHAKPLVSGAAIRFDGQVAVFDSRRDHAPCYNCLFPEGGDVEEVRCAVMGVFAPLTGIIGATQAAEALKLLIGCGEPLAGRLLLLDGLAMEWRAIAVPRDPACAVCSAHRPD